MRRPSRRSLPPRWTRPDPVRPDDPRHGWNSRYADAGDDYVFGTAPNAFLAAQARWLTPGQRALSVADGEGRNGVWLAEQGLQVDAVEFAPAAIAKARRLAAARGVTPNFIEADLLTWDWPVSAYEVVAAIFIQFVGPAERARLFACMTAALRPGGLLLIQGYTPRQLDYRTGGPSAVENLYTQALLRDAFAGLEILHLAEYDSHVDEGHGHRGTSALIDLIARKP